MVMWVWTTNVSVWATAWGQSASWQHTQDRHRHRRGGAWLRPRRRVCVGNNGRHQGRVCNLCAGSDRITSPSPPPSTPPPPTHHIQTHNIHTNTLTHTRAPTYTRTHTHTPIHAHVRTPTHPHAHIHIHTRTPHPTYTHPTTPTRTHPHVHTHTAHPHPHPPPSGACAGMRPGWPCADCCQVGQPGGGGCTGGGVGG